MIQEKVTITPKGREILQLLSSNPQGLFISELRDDLPWGRQCGIEGLRTACLALETYGLVKMQGRIKLADAGLEHISEPSEQGTVALQ